MHPVLAQSTVIFTDLTHVPHHLDRCLSSQGRSPGISGLHEIATKWCLCMRTVSHTHTHMHRHTRARIQTETTHSDLQRRIQTQRQNKAMNQHAHLWILFLVFFMRISPNHCSGACATTHFHSRPCRQHKLPHKYLDPRTPPSQYAHK